MTDCSRTPEAIDPGEGWELYEPVIGERYSEGTEAKHKLCDDWMPCGHVHAGDELDDRFIYRRPKPVQTPQQSSPSAGDYVPPAGWRVKGDDEVVTEGDKYSHLSSGRLSDFDYLCRSSIGFTAAKAIKEYAGWHGYILSPIATQPPDVSQEPQNRDTMTVAKMWGEAQEQVTLDIDITWLERKARMADKLPEYTRLKSEFGRKVVEMIGGGK